MSIPRLLTVLLLACLPAALAGEPSDPAAVAPRVDALEGRVAQVEANVESLAARVDRLAAATPTPTESEPTEPAPAPNADPQPAEPRMQLGMNLDPPGYWSTAWVYGDLMLQAEYRKGAKAWLAFWDAAKHGADYPRASFIIVPSRGAQVIDTGNGLKIKAPENARERGVQVWLPLAVRDQLFHPTFLDRLRPFKVLRFMDWMDTNSSPVKTWADRGHHKVPIPYMVELCNQLDADPWFCMPHMADDDYVRQFAELVKNQLEPNRKIYVEYSNEIWNGLFRQYDWLREKHPDRQAFLQAGLEAKRDFAIWSEVFADTPERLVRVAAGQRNNPYVTEVITETLGGDFDAVSCAAYHGPGGETARSWTAQTTSEDIIDAMRQNLHEELQGGRLAHAELARRWSEKLGRKIRLVAYEGGQHTTPRGKNVPWFDAFAEAQRHPDMYALYMENLRAWEEAGGDLFCAFNYVRRIDKNGAWGHLEYQDQPLSQAPKYQALIDYAAGRVPTE